MRLKHKELLKAFSLFTQNFNKPCCILVVLISIVVIPSVPRLIVQNGEDNNNNEDGKTKEPGVDDVQDPSF